MRFNTLAAALGGVSLLVLASTARANLSFSGSASAVFGKPTNSDPTIHPVDTGMNTNEITDGHGEPDPNTLTLGSDGFSGIGANEAFAVSELKYFNGETSNSASDFPITLTLTFTDPSGVVEPFDFSFHLTLTPNQYQPLTDPRNDDTLTVPVVYPTQTFVDDGNTLTLELLGFSSDGGVTIDSEFRLPESETATSTLYAEITAPAPQGAPTPLPASAWGGLALLGVLGATMAVRRRAARA